MEMASRTGVGLAPPEFVRSLRRESGSFSRVLEARFRGITGGGGSQDEKSATWAKRGAVESRGSPPPARPSTPRGKSNDDRTGAR